MSNKKPTIFLDRDGTVNELNGYITSYDQVKILDGVPEAIRIFNELKYLVIIITNQPVIEMGLVTIKNLEKIHIKIKSEIKKKGGHIDAFFYCPHMEVNKANASKKTDSCSCRKPQTGLVRNAMAIYEIDLPNSIMIGDSWRDVELAKNLGIKYFQIVDKPVSGEKSSESLKTLLESAQIIEKQAKANVEFKGV
jgi:D-glycero-D-manno-heptose 1,7-bisphosphate phosphatase